MRCIFLIQTVWARAKHMAKNPLSWALALAIAGVGCSDGLEIAVGAVWGPYDVPGDPPVISSVQWTHVLPCNPSDTYHKVTISVVATDPDTPASDLSYVIFVGRCGKAGPGGAVKEATLVAATGEVTCAPATGPTYVYEGTAEVRDREGHSDIVHFSFSRCQDGEMTF